MLQGSGTPLGMRAFRQSYARAPIDTVPFRLLRTVAENLEWYVVTILLPSPGLAGKLTISPERSEHLAINQ
jgi:hypothetical protein